jgi:acetyl esterase
VTSALRSLLPGLMSALALSSCAEHPELRENNDSDRYTLVEDVPWAAPGGFDLSMDIYTPKSGKDSYPVVVMFHGGGWLINDKSIMDQASAYLATHGEYVICNVDYRLLSDNDNSVKLNEIVDDVFGAVLWVKDHIGRYQGDSGRIAVTGDSAGGHLSAMVVNLGDRLSSSPFAGASLNFQPSYLPHGKTAEQVAQQHGLEVQAAILSYGAFDIFQGATDGFESVLNPFWLVSGSIARGLFGSDRNVIDHPDLYRALSPAHNIPNSRERLLPPQLLTVGTDDPVVTPASVNAYHEKLRSAGHPAEYWAYDGKSHAFLDSGSNAFLGSSFEADAPPALDVMIRFLDGVFYRELEDERAG